MRIAITGSSGYIGSRLVAALSDLPGVEAIVGMDARDPTPMPPAPFEHIRADVRFPFDQTFAEKRVNAAIHLAFSFEPKRARSLEQAINLNGTCNFLRACVAAKVTRAIVLGSATAYGARRDNPDRLVESSPLRARPSFPYSYDKRLCDEI